MNLVTVTQPASLAAEAYRTLRANVHFASLDSPLRTILVASPDTAASAALVLANLGVSLAQSGKRVLVVDANVREPSLHGFFDLPNVGGLAAALGGRPSEPNPQPSSVDGLSVLPAGLGNDGTTDALSSDRMVQLITALAQRADVVLFAAPAVTMFSDAAVLASRVDGTLLVVNTGKTRRQSAESAKDILARAHARMIGAVMLGAA
jgi:non-specific protein-tyrosine kinase